MLTSYSEELVQSFGVKAEPEKVKKQRIEPQGADKFLLDDYERFAFIGVTS